jgi:hypothetical protein
LPVVSTCCLALIAAFWIFAGAWLYAVNGAWFLYVPLLAIGLYSLFFALEGLDSEGARRRSFQLAKENWVTETGGLGALRAVLIVPGILFYLDAKLLFEGHVHSPGAKALLGFVLLCGFALWAAAAVVGQVFAVELYRVSTG